MRRLKNSAILIVMIWGILSPISAQNMITNGDLSFHVRMGDCPRLPFEGISIVSSWYNIANTTVDYYVPFCQYRPISGLPFDPFFHYDVGDDGFLGFWGSFNRDFTTASEAFGVPLTSRLSSEMGYWFSVDIRPRGKNNVNHDVDAYPVYCPIEPQMAFEIYTHDNKISGVTDNHTYNLTQINATNVLSLNILSAKDTTTSDEWTRFSGCFVGVDGHNHVGFSMSIMSYTPTAPCDAPYDPTDKIQNYSLMYFNADNFSLLPYPLEVIDTILLCAELDEISWNAQDYFTSIDLSEFNASWEDGNSNMIKAFTDGGRYNSKLNHLCGSTTFDIYIDRRNCEPVTYIPNIFTPNGDGVNDRFIPHININFPIENVSFKIFDRWGTKLFESSIVDGNIGWNGKFNGADVSSTVYVWNLQYDVVYPSSRRRFTESGDVLITR